MITAVRPQLIKFENGFLSSAKIDHFAQ